MKKIIFLILFTVLFAFGSSQLDDSFVSFGIEGGAEKNSVLYKMVSEKDIDKNQKEFFKQTILKNKTNYLTAKRVLEEKGVPLSFLWIAMTESKFNSATTSKKARHIGVWQMASYSSKMFGLKVGKGSDERRSVEKSTAAFADYCHYMHKEFKNWGVVALAYNCGDGRLKKVIRKAGTDDLNTILSPNKKLLSKTSKIYFKRVMTLSAIANDDEIKEFLTNLENGEKG